jgi:peptidoglycan/LPS O-acetylase OafA/YrhL
MTSQITSDRPRKASLVGWFLVEGALALLAVTGVATSCSEGSAVNDLCGGFRSGTIYAICAVLLGGLVAGWGAAYVRRKLRLFARAVWLTLPAVAVLAVVVVVQSSQ